MCSIAVRVESLVIPRNGRKTKSKMAAAAILNFTGSWILDNSDCCMANIYPPIKFDANIFIGDRNMAEKQNLRWRPPPY